MRTVVTGANGYLASNLVEKLAQRGDEVSAVINNNSFRVGALARKYPSQISIYESGDLNEAVRDAKEVYHLAGFFTTGRFSAQIHQLAKSNLLSTISLYEAIEECAPDAHTVLASSFSQLDLEGNNKADTYYSGMKALVELGTPELDGRLSFLRVSDTFGPNDSRKKVHNICAEQVMRGEIFEFKSSANTQLALTHTDDVADAFMFLCNSRLPGPFNLLNEELRITLAEIGDALQQGTKGSVRFPNTGAGSTQIPFGVDLIPGWGPTRRPHDHLHSALILGHSQ